LPGELAEREKLLELTAKCAVEQLPFENLTFITDNHPSDRMTLLSSFNLQLIVGLKPRQSQDSVQA
jgi:hypothetical protein